MAKKQPIVKYKGTPPDNGVLLAKIPVTLTGPKLGFVHRHLARIETHTEIELPAGFVLKFCLVPELSSRGMVVLESISMAPSGFVAATVINCGREIVEIHDRDRFLQVWIEPIHQFALEAM